MSGDWLTIRRGRAPLVLSIPHAGVDIPGEIETRLVSPWLARKDTDWWVDRLYELAGVLDATIVQTAISRTVIDVNRDPSGGSLYPGQATTELCPTHDVRRRAALSERRRCRTRPRSRRRKARWFVPYHEALSAELERLRGVHDQVVLYDVPFDPFVGPASVRRHLAPLQHRHERRSELCSRTDRGGGGRVRRDIVQPRHQRAVSGRLHHPPSREAAAGVHAIQMELACRELSA